MNANFRNVLVLAPHTDDGELGAGGFMAKLIEQGAKVTYVAFYSSRSVLSIFQGMSLKEVMFATEKRYRSGKRHYI